METCGPDDRSVSYSQYEPRPQRPISQAPFHVWAEDEGGEAWTSFFRIESGYLLRFPALADFEVSLDGRRVDAVPAPRVRESAVRHLYVNQVRPLALSRQQRWVLHASAVDLGGVAVAFAGCSGRGKSTLAASFATAGASFLADDALELSWRDGELMARPSDPSLRLWSDSCEALGRTQEPSRRGGPTKSRIPASEALAFCPEPRPLHSILFLGSASEDTPRIRRMHAGEVLVGLLQQSFLLDTRHEEALAWHFGQVTRMANLETHFHLDYPRRFDALPRVREAIAEHARVPHVLPV